jgi:16S rRNA (adenine1518-N6/adenine1519-N6)-dimethyltransferase
MSLGPLPPLRAGLAAHGLEARKSFGQHFLLDLNVTRKIARLAGALDEGAVIEVGPGPGGLTRALLEAGAMVIAIEKDRRFLPLLEELAQAAPGRLRVVEADALEADELGLVSEAGASAPVRIVANLPYNVSVPLLIKWLRLGQAVESLTLMFQKEVAQRIVAAPGQGAYGRLSVLVAATATAEIVMALPARAFTPPPKVDSAVVRLVARADAPAPALLASLERVTQAAFGQRRKMLRSSLKPLGGEDLCRAAGVDPGLRAEAIGPDAFLSLARLVQQPLHERA